MDGLDNGEIQNKNLLKSIEDFVQAIPRYADHRI